jgi:hypothetical protein
MKYTTESQRLDGGASEGRRWPTWPVVGLRCLCWSSLIVAGLCWSSLSALAVVGLCWQSWVFVGMCWFSMTCVCLCWPSLASVGLCWPEELNYYLNTCKISLVVKRINKENKTYLGPNDVSRRLSPHHPLRPLAVPRRPVLAFVSPRCPA